MFLNIKVKFVSFLAFLWIRSLKVRCKFPENYGSGVIGVWHRDLLATCAAFKNSGVHTLISKSKDGDFFAATVERLGYKVSRGSDTLGSSNVRFLLSTLIEGGAVAMALDGPHGPAGVVKPGSFWLTKKSGRPLWLVQVHYHKYFTLHSWDEFIIPYPMSSIDIEINYFLDKQKRIIQ